MKNLIVYSSLTGNTKKVAEVCKSITDESWELKKIDEEINTEDYSKIILGFWVDKGTADKKSLELIKKISGKKVSFFMTLGAYPNSEHSKKVAEKIKKLFEQNQNEVHSSFACQGAIDPKLIDWMKKLPAEHPHSPNEERKKRWESAAKHPDESDFENAKTWFKEVVAWSI